MRAPRMRRDLGPVMAISAHGRAVLVATGGIEAQQAGNGDRRTILVVEDEPALLTLIARLLERAGYRVHAAPTAERAIEIARADGPFHLLLTDVILPGSNGCELSRSLARLQPGMPTLFMTGYGDDVIGRIGLDARRVRILGKPFRPETLYEFVQQAMSGAVVSR